jgi:hypothetical protein
MAALDLPGKALVQPISVHELYRLKILAESVERLIICDGPAGRLAVELDPIGGRRRKNVVGVIKC